MIQYCRYCINAVGHDFDLIWCTEKHIFRSGSQCTRPNKCPKFEFCSTDALNPDHEYKPREETPGEDSITENQISLF